MISIESETVGLISMIFLGNLQIELASDPMKFGSDYMNKTFIANAMWSAS